MPSNLEPRFTLPHTTPRSSKNSLVISGLQVYVYGLEELKNKTNVNIAVLYLAHQRTRTYLVTEDMAHEVLHRCRTDGTAKSVELIAVTFNMRNHGDREISPQANCTWKDGNEAHGVDLLSLIDGSALDFKLVMSHLPAYYPQFNKFRTIMAGISLGGHTAWRLPAVAAGQVEATCIVVGSPDLTTLLLSRLRLDPTLFPANSSGLYKVPYDELVEKLDEQQAARWPRRLHELMSEQDRLIDAEFPDIPLLLMGGKEDPLVPVKFTEPWLKKREGNSKIEFFVQENTGHSCTKEMVAKMAIWLSQLLTT